MVDELNWTGAQLQTAAADSATQIKDALLAKTLHNYELALSCRAPLSLKGYTYVNTHTHTYTYGVTFYGLSSCLGDACWQQQQRQQPLRFLALNSFRISHLEFGHYSMFYAATLPEDTERVFKGLLRVYSGIFRAAWHFYVLSRLHILWPQQSVRCCSV